MGPWIKDFQQVSQVTGWEPIRLHLNDHVNWWVDCATWTYLNLWFLPHRMPGLHSDVDKFVSQFTLNGIKASNICRPS